MSSTIPGARRQRPGRRHRARVFRIRRFCEAYLEHQNGTRAAIAAGYSVKRAATTASELLHSPDVLARLAQLQRAREITSTTSEPS